ncbi:translation initiation factor IF-2 subunit beta [Candidatus Micrarchaeota archaeon]|nr:translation initiation factor IF-2 subunit beta [Candidatus Micrarchaeota archaeon]
MDDYEKLLERARSSLPEKTASGERFEPPAAETFMQGSKTVIKNFEAICVKIRREPAMLSKYLSKELAIPGTIEGSRLILHGKFYDRVINEKLATFISKYVICKECNRPDTKISEGVHGIRTLVCDACGARSPVK